MRKAALAIAILFGFVATGIVTQTAEAAKPAKVKICHVNSANDVFEVPGFGVVVFGREIEVSEKALDAHLAHGDSDEYLPLTEDLRDFLEVLLDIKLPNADCVFFEPLAP